MSGDKMVITTKRASFDLQNKHSVIFLGHIFDLFILVTKTIKLIAFYKKLKRGSFRKFFQTKLPA
jgi:hypothetical protein